MTSRSRPGRAAAGLASVRGRARYAAGEVTAPPRISASVGDGMEGESCVAVAHRPAYIIVQHVVYWWLACCVRPLLRMPDSRHINRYCVVLMLQSQYFPRIFTRIDNLRSCAEYLNPPQTVGLQ